MDPYHTHPEQTPDVVPTRPSPVARCLRCVITFVMRYVSGLLTIVTTIFLLAATSLLVTRGVWWVGHKVLSLFTNDTDMVLMEWAIGLFLLTSVFWLPNLGKDVIDIFKKKNKEGQ